MELTEVKDPITKYICSFAGAVESWGYWYLPVKDRKEYIRLCTVGSKYPILSRCLVGKQKGTTVGYSGTSVQVEYVMLDNTYYVTEVTNDFSLDESGRTDFRSVAEFNHLYLGFYLVAWNDYIRDIELSQSSKKKKHKFLQNLTLNEAYIKNTKIVVQEIRATANRNLVDLVQKI